MSTNKPVARRALSLCLGLAGLFTASTAAAQPGMAAQLNADRFEVSVKTGGWQHFDLVAGSDRANQWYLILGSVSGPGAIRVQGVTIPLSYDIYTEFTLARPNAGFIRNQLGTLDAGGNATADFFVPAGLPRDLVGLQVNHAYVVVTEDGTISAVSNPAPLQLTDEPVLEDRLLAGRSVDPSD